jgi:hypothetical protein
MPPKVIGPGGRDVVGVESPTEKPNPGASEVVQDKGSARSIRHVGGPDEILIVPAIPEHHAEGVGALPNQARHVVRSVEDARLVVGLGGIEDLVANPPAIDPRLIIAQTADAQLRLENPIAQTELTAQQRRPRTARTPPDPSHILQGCHHYILSRVPVGVQHEGAEHAHAAVHDPPQPPELPRHG